MSVLYQLHVDHQQQTRLLDCLKYCLMNDFDDVRVRSEVNVIMPLALHYLCHYSEEWHHPIEEAACHILLRKNISQQEKEFIFLNKTEHQTLESLSSALLRCYRSQKEGDCLMPAFKRDFLKFIALQKRHTEYENKRIYPLFDDYLNDSDWGRVDKIYKKAEQYKKPEEITKQYQALFNFIVESEKLIRRENHNFDDTGNHPSNLPTNSRGIKHDIYR